MLDCQNTRQLLDAFEDGELDAVTSLQVQTHLESCEDCQRRLISRRVLNASLTRIREATPKASSALRRKVLAEDSVTAARSGAWGRNIGWGALAAVLLAFVLSFLVEPDLHASGNDVRPFVQSHKGWALAHAPIDLQTSDSEEAAVWFGEKVPGLRAPRETPPGYTLVGTRIAEVDGQTVGVLLYEHEGRRISCFVRPERRPATEGFDQIALQGEAFQAGRCRGHQIVSWGSGDGSIVLVGELGEDSLLAFAEQNAVDVPGGHAGSSGRTRG